MARGAPTLRELEAKFLEWNSRGHFRITNDRAKAKGLIFACPRCYVANGSDLTGVHKVICWDPSVPEDESPGPGRWSIVGDFAEKVSLVAKSSSVQLNGGCRAHFFVTDGQVSFV